MTAEPAAEAPVVEPPVPDGRPPTWEDLQTVPDDLPRDELAVDRPFPVRVSCALLGA